MSNDQVIKLSGAIVWTGGWVIMYCGREPWPSGLWGLLLIGVGAYMFFKY